MFKRYLAVLVIGVVLGAGGCYWFTKEDHNLQDTHMSNSTSGLQSTSEIHANPKQSSADPDVVVSQQYVAVVNGEKVSVPVVKTDSDSSSQPDSTSGSVADKTQQGVTGHIDQTIDITPLLSKLQPTWEVGAGYMHLEDSYGCVSIQRNYRQNKAIEMTTFINTDGHIKGFMVQHKWMFH